MEKRTINNFGINDRVLIDNKHKGNIVAAGFMHRSYTGKTLIPYFLVELQEGFYSHPDKETFISLVVCHPDSLTPAI